ATTQRPPLRPKAPNCANDDSFKSNVHSPSKTGVERPLGRTPMAHLTLTIDGASRTIDIDDPDMPLLYALRDELQLYNRRFGCGLGQCGACTVHIDGHAVRSCITPVSALAGKKITTLAGLGTPEKPHPIQQAWLEEQVSQCAYCINGWIMTAAELIDRNPK